MSILAIFFLPQHGV